MAATSCVMSMLWREWRHQAACLSATALVSWLVFSNVSDGWIGIAWMLLPLGWAALAFDIPTTVAAIVMMDIAAATGRNPYDYQNASALKLNFALITALTFSSGIVLALAAISGARRRDHAALRDLNAELEARIKAEVALRETVLLRAKRAKRLRAIGQVAGGVAHEFNNILQTIMGAFEIIQRHPDDVIGVERMVALGMTAAGRGGTVTRRLLAFARRAPLHAIAVDVATELTVLHDPLTRMLGQQIALTLAIQNALPAVFVDRTELETAVINLATNARDAMPAGGTLTISAATVVIGDGYPRATLGAGRYVCITVQDSGTGMDAAVLAHAEEPFFTTKPIGFGTGLGLSMAKGFAEQSGGGLVVESTPGAGTTVTLWLPLGDPA